MIFKQSFLFLLRLFFDNVFNPIYKSKLAENIAVLCKDDSIILDVGCDDGSVASMIMELNSSLEIIGIDVQTDRVAKIPRTMYNGEKMPYPDNSFDIVMALDVLHHTKNIPLLLEEMRRVSRRYIIIKDHMTYSIL